MKNMVKYAFSGKIKTHPLFRGILIAFLSCLSVLGLYFYTTQGLPTYPKPTINFLPSELKQLLENFENEHDDECPDVLIRQGSGLKLYNTKNTSIPPIQFENVQAYQNYLDRQNQNGKKCPVLYLQEETNTQGENVLRMRPTLDNSENALPISLSAPGRFLVEKMPIAETNESRQIYETPHDNATNVSSFDPTGQNIGRFTIIDQKHTAEENSAYKSANPLDTNWGGTAYSQNQVDSGRYSGSYVSKPVFPQA